MCVFCVVPPNVTPTKTMLEDSALNNPDGFGFAFLIKEENRIHVEKTMNADASISRFLAMRQQYPNTYAMWHARIATHGSVSVDNCHPFHVSYDNRTVMFHNGVLPIEEPLGDKRSDTRIFAEDILPSIGGISALDNPKIFNLVEGFSAGSKLAFMTLDDSAEHDIYMVNERLGFTDVSGIWWSNRTCYLTPKYSYGGYLDMGLSLDKSCADDNSFGYTCMMCETVQEVKISDDAEAEYFCTACQSCLDCGMYKTECMCYTPAHAYWLGR